MLYSTYTQTQDTEAIDIAAVLAQHLFPQPSYSVYPIPYSEDERRRLAVAHHALVVLLQGLYCAPLPDDMQNILDLGCGPDGRWCRAMSQHFPTSWVVGMDLAIQPESWGDMAQCQPLVKDILDPLPFPDDSFDFVHMGNMLYAIPYNAWPAVVAEMIRVTRPGGYIEIKEFNPTLMSQWCAEPYGDYTRQLFTWLYPMLYARGIVPENVAPHLRELFAEQQMRHEMRVYTCPLGSSGNRYPIKSQSDLGARLCAEGGRSIDMLTASIIAELEHMTPALIEYIAPTLIVEGEPITDTLREKIHENIDLALSQLKDEWDRHQTCIQLHVHWGMKPIS